MAKVRSVSERLKELKQIEKRLLDDLVREIAKTAVKSFDPKTGSITDTTELASIIKENWGLLSKKYQIRSKKEVKHEENI